MNWHKGFDERQLDEIRFSKVYLKDFSHGTDGHNAKIIMAKMANKLDEIEMFLSNKEYIAQSEFEEFVAQVLDILARKV